jgi:hypothetical protein
MVERQAVATRGTWTGLRRTTDLHVRHDAARPGRRHVSDARAWYAVADEYHLKRSPDALMITLRTTAQGIGAPGRRPELVWTVGSALRLTAKSQRKPSVAPGFQDKSVPRLTGPACRGVAGQPSPRKETAMTTQKPLVFDHPLRGRIYDSIAETIGNTPLVRIPKITAEEGITADICLKLEFFNPIGSVKDRIGVNLILALEESGALKPGGTLIEPTSGNTGIGLAFVAAARATG